MNKSPTDHVVWQESSDNTALKYFRSPQNNPKVLWLTGLSGAGKSTLASALQKRLLMQGFYAFILDGDNVRHGLCRDLGFSKEDRNENIRRVAEVAKLYGSAGISAICSFISPAEENRNLARKIIGTNFVEIYLDCALETCEMRDVKGLYKKARKGEIVNFTGVGDVYEPPVSPDLILKTDVYSVDICVNQVIDYLFNE